MRRVLIANRGEIACRVIRACRALDLEPIAVFSEADANALHVTRADTAEAIGGAKPADSYLDTDKILSAARASEADAVHPGYGFLAENAAFARAVEAAGLLWVGPTPATIEAMGDKERARQIAQGAGVPVLAGSARFAPGDLGGLAAAAEEVGFPLLVKAAAGGGGIGMRQVGDREQLSQVARSDPGDDGRAFLRRWDDLPGAVGAQGASRGGPGFRLGRRDARSTSNERECSIQRRFQKIIEESPAPGLASQTRQDMAAAAVRLTQAEAYRGAGTVEFVVDAETQEFFLSRNEHAHPGRARGHRNGDG